MWKAVKKFWLDEEGVTMIEYALIAALVAIASIVAWAAVGSEIGLKMNEVQTALSNANGTIQ